MLLGVQFKGIVPSSSVSHKNSVTLGLRDFSYFLSSTLVCEPNLLKISMNANIDTTFSWIKKNDFKGHSKDNLFI